MTLKELKHLLPTLETISFKLPNGDLVPSHFHITEVGQVTKNFIDCGGTIRSEKTVNFQLWYSDDTDHRLFPQKLAAILTLSEEKLGIEDAPIEVEYQLDTIGKFSLDFDGQQFVLKNKHTACLLEDACQVPQNEKPKINLRQLQTLTTCNPGSGCC